MPGPCFYLNLFASSYAKLGSVNLENRVKQFLQHDPQCENLDEARFAKVFGSSEKADYLLADRVIVAELKTLNGSPLSRIAAKLKDRFSQPDAPVIYGSLGVNRALQHLSDGEEFGQRLVNLAGRAIRQHLRKANRQIASTKRLLGIDSASGLVILINESEPLIAASTIADAVRSTLESCDDYPNISHVWSIIEAHKVALSSETAGFPQVYVLRSSCPDPEIEFVGRMVKAWGQFNGSETKRIHFNGDWSAFSPIYVGNPPTMEIF